MNLYCKCPNPWLIINLEKNIYVITIFRQQKNELEYEYDGNSMYKCINSMYWKNWNDIYENKLDSF